MGGRQSVMTGPRGRRGNYTSAPEDLYRGRLHHSKCLSRGDCTGTDPMGRQIFAKGGPVIRHRHSCTQAVSNLLCP